MRLRQIEVFHAVYSSGSVTRAAELLSVSQPSVSKVLAHAEQQMGFKLFERVRGKLIPTQEADHLFQMVVEITDGVDRVRQAVAQLRVTDKGALRVAATPAFGIDFLPSAMASYLKKHDDLLFSLETLPHEALASALLESRVDLALAFDPENMPGIGGELLGYGRFVVLVPSDSGFEAGQPLSIGDLSSLSFIRLDNKSALDRLLTTHIEASEVNLDYRAVAGSYQIAKAMVSHGIGAAITDDVTARSGCDENVSVHPLEPELRFRISALHMDQVPMSLKCREFVEHLKGSLGQFLHE